MATRGHALWYSVWRNQLLVFPAQIVPGLWFRDYGSGTISFVTIIVNWLGLDREVCQSASGWANSPSVCQLLLFNSGNLFFVFAVYAPHLLCDYRALQKCRWRSARAIKLSHRQWRMVPVITFQINLLHRVGCNVRPVRHRTITVFANPFKYIKNLARGQGGCGHRNSIVRGWMFDDKSAG